MLNLLLFILVCFGATSIITGGHIFKPLRDWVDGIFTFNFLSCSLCMGFHVGWIVYLMFYYSGIILFSSALFGWFLAGCISSGTSYLLSQVVGDDGIRIVKKFDD